MLHRLMPRSLERRLLFTYVVLMVLGLGGLILWTGLRLQTAIVEQVEHDLELQAFIIADALREPLEHWKKGENQTERSLNALVHSYTQNVGVYITGINRARAYALNTGARVTIVTPSFHVLISSDDAVPAHFEHNHPEIVAAQTGNEQHDIRWDEWRNEERLFVAAPIIAVEDEAKELKGIVQLSVPMAPLYTEMRHTWASLVGAGGMVLVATALVSLLLARQVAGPIRNLTVVTEAMAAGELDQQVKPTGPAEIERLGRAFNRMAGRVREMLARQQAFVANAAHELRSPLTSLQLRIDMLQRHSQEYPELAQHYLSQMEGEIERLRRLVDHLLTLSRLDEGELPPQSPLDLAPLLYEVADEMHPLAQMAGLRLWIDVPPHLPTVMANADSMHTMVRNLLDNAIKYTPAGGEVVLRAMTEGLRHDERDRRSLIFRRSPPKQAGLAVVIQVTDTGSGIPAEHLPHIFGRFYRVDKGRSRGQGGAGLGLSLVRSIVEAHSGWVSVESAPEQGSTFTVHLPVTDNQGPATSPPAPE